MAGVTITEIPRGGFSFELTKRSAEINYLLQRENIVCDRCTLKPNIFFLHFCVHAGMRP